MFGNLVQLSPLFISNSQPVEEEVACEEEVVKSCSICLPSTGHPVIYSGG